MAMNLAAPTEFAGDASGSAGTAAAPRPAPPPPPEAVAGFFPQFDILECLGRGGMGIVYKAVQKSLHRTVALKILAPEREKDTAFARRFAAEAETLARLNHPNIVTVHDFGEAGGMFYLVMEYVDGMNLRGLLRERKLSPQEALAIVPPICEALQYAHNQGVVHRDIKPENVLLDKDGRVKIADFGIAKMLSGSEPAANARQCPDTASRGAGGVAPGPTDGRVIGTPPYMAPEQVEKPQSVDHRADIYSLGVVFYEMLTGELPAGPFPPPSVKVQIDVRLDEVVLRALEKEPARRYQHASDVKTMVETITATRQNAVTQQPTATTAATHVDTVDHWLAVGALSAVVFFAGMAAGLTVLWALPWGGRLNLAWFALMLLTCPFVAVDAHRAVRNWGAAARSGTLPAGVPWLKAWGWMAWILAVPALGFGLFFLNALLSETGPWNPATDEAVIVPMIWIGSVLLLVSGWVLRRTAARLQAAAVQGGQRAPQGQEAGGRRTEDGGRSAQGEGQLEGEPDPGCLWSWMGFPVAETRHGQTGVLWLGVLIAWVVGFGLGGVLIPMMWIALRSWMAPAVSLPAALAIGWGLLTAYLALGVCVGLRKLRRPGGGGQVLSDSQPPGWVQTVRWAARVLGTLLVLLGLPFVLAEGLPPIALQPTGVQLTFIGGFLLLVGFITGWWREGRAAILIASGWTVIRISEIDFDAPTILEVAPAVALLYALCWWATQGRNTVRAAAVAMALAVLLAGGRLFCPANVFVSGTIRDAVTDQIIADAELRLLPRPGRAPGEADWPNVRSDREGRFRLYVGWYREGQPVEISAAGYESQTAPLGRRPLGRRRLQQDFRLRSP